MTSAEIPQVPGDEAWWTYLKELADQALEGTTCERVHPKISFWLQGMLNNPPKVSKVTVFAIHDAYGRIKEKLHNPLEADDYESHIRQLLLVGMGVRNSSRDRIIEYENREEIRQAVDCLTREVNNSAFTDLLVSNLRTTRLAQLAKNFPGKGKRDCGIMIVGWAFQNSIVAGQFDDL